jgi:hypothetical protein
LPIADCQLPIEETGTLLEITPSQTKAIQSAVKSAHSKGLAINDCRLKVAPVRIAAQPVR